MTSPFVLSRTLPGVDAVVGPGFPWTDFSVWPGPKGVKLASDARCGGASSASFSSLSNWRFVRLRRLRLFVDGLPYPGGTRIAAGLVFH